MTWLILGAAVSSLIVSLFSTAVVRRMAPRWGLIDRPGHRKVHTTPTPMGGGLAVFAGIVVPLACGYLLLLWWPKDVALPAIVAPHVAGILQQAPKLWILLGGAFVLVVL